MLVLSRRTGEKIWVGTDVCITVTGMDRGVVRVGIEAPHGTLILRGELRDRQHATEQANSEDSAADGQPAPQADGRPSTDRSFNEDATAG